MKLQSCKKCGVIIDLDRIEFPDMWDAHDTIDPDYGIWNGEDYVPYIPCPVCKEAVTEEDF